MKKRLLFVLGLCLAITAYSGVMKIGSDRVTLNDNISAADTTATSVRLIVDTIIMDVSELQRFSFAIYADIDTNWLNDSTLVIMEAQLHPDADWDFLAATLDTPIILTGSELADSAISTWHSSDTLGPFERLRFIVRFRDSVEADVPGIFGNEYDVAIKIGLKGWK